MYTGLLLYICILWRHFFMGIISCFKFNTCFRYGGISTQPMCWQYLVRPWQAWGVPSSLVSPPRSARTGSGTLSVAWRPWFSECPILSALFLDRHWHLSWCKVLQPSLCSTLSGSCHPFQAFSSQFVECAAPCRQPHRHRAPPRPYLPRKEILWPQFGSWREIFRFW